jgi:hypothetical protein
MVAQINTIITAREGDELSRSIELSKYGVVMVSRILLNISDYM